MGCGTSSDTGSIAIESPQHTLSHTDMAMKGLRLNETVLDAYQRLDEEICVLEGMCPGPRLATSESWITFLESQTLAAENDAQQIPLHMLNYTDSDDTIEGVKFNRDSHLEKEKLSINKVRQLAERLNVATDPERAAKYEEFIASVSRKYMADVNKALKEDILEHAKKRANELLQQYSKLRILYSEQDGLIASVTGGTYTSVTEQKIDDELEAARQARDKLGGVAEQWRIAANLLRTSAKGAMLGAESWNLVGSSRVPAERITLGTDCRSSIQGSIVALKGAQEALPQIEINHITQRQITAVMHANEYLLTDMADEDRYHHTNNVLNVYQKNVSLAIKWLHETFKKSIKKDLDEAEDLVLTTAKKLRQFRVEYIKQLGGTKQYIPVSLSGI